MPVDHHTEAYGIALSHKDGWKITYSGDTEPCKSLVDAGEALKFVHWKCVNVLQSFA